MTNGLPSRARPSGEEPAIHPTEEASACFDPCAAPDAPGLYRLLVDNVQDCAIFALDSTGVILSWNAGAEHLKGYAPAEIIGRHYSILFPPEDAAEGKPARCLELAAARGRYKEEGWRVRKDGSQMWAHIVLTALRDPGGELVGYTKVARDLTDQRRADEALRESEARFRGAFDHAATGMAIADPSGRWIRVNPALGAILGYSEEELLGITFSSITYPEDIAPNLQLFNRALAGEIDRYQLEKRFIHRGGHVVWVALNAVAVRDDARALLYFVVQIQDITQRHQAERQREAALAALRGSEERFRALIENAADPVAIFDAAGSYQYVSPAHERVLGYAPEELFGTSVFATVHPEDVGAVAAAFQQMVEQPDARPTVAYHTRHKDGSWRTLHVVGRSLLNHPAVRGIVVNATDVTERHSLEAQLQQAQKMDALGQLAGGIAHDFNNLLTAILSNSELALSEVGTGPARQDIEAIRQTAERAAGLTRQLLAFSRKQVVEPRLLDLNEVVADTERMLRRVLGESTTLHVDLAPSLGSVLANPGQLEQVLVNLAVNARDAMPEGGTLTIRTRDVRVDEALARAHKGLRPGSYVALAVADTGVGIPPELHIRIFEPFFTTKAIGQGTGLGLSTVYGSVKQWGGYTAVESAPGTGAIFTIYLPRQEGAPKSGDRRDAQDLPTGSETVLVVEDELTVRNSIRRILSRHGYTVLEAQHGTEALRIIDEARAPIDLILTDLVMPEMGGRELIAKVQTRDDAPTILVMSGYDAQAGMRGEPLPPNAGFLEKPFTVSGLLRSVRSALDPSASAHSG